MGDADLGIPVGIKNGRRMHLEGSRSTVGRNELVPVGHAESRAGVGDRTWRMLTAEGMESRNPQEKQSPEGWERIGRVSWDLS